jgi:hypothetical protein
MLRCNNLLNLGQLGNQMFLYAIVRIIAEKNAYRFRVPEGQLFEYFPGLRNDTEDDSPILGTYQEICGFHPESMSYTPEFLELMNNRNINGYFQNHRYYLPHREVIQNWYSPNLEIKDYVRSLDIKPNACALHFRCGNDVLIHPNEIFPLMSMQYYLDGIKTLKIPSEFIVTADVSHERLLQIYPELKELNYRFFSSSPINDMFTLNSCSSFVLAPSTFSWWAAFLNSEAKVVAPKNWIHVNYPVPCEITIPDWTTIHNSNHFLDKGNFK